MSDEYDTVGEGQRFKLRRYDQGAFRYAIYDVHQGRIIAWIGTLDDAQLIVHHINRSIRTPDSRREQ